MKTWITYLASLFLGLATALLLGDSAWSLPVFGTLYSLAVNTGALLALAMVVVSTTSAIASLRKDALGSKTAGISLLWTLVTALVLPLLTGLVAGAFPVAFPVSTTAGSGSVSSTYVSSVFVNAWQLTTSGDPVLFLSAADSFLVPVVLLALIVGWALKPDADIIRPAYITMNSLSEVMYRIARAISYFGYILVYLTSCYMFTMTYQEKTFFVDAAFSALLVIIPLSMSLIVLPVLYEIFTGAKGNPFKTLYRNIACQAAALTSGNYIFTMPFTMACTRYNDGVQKRIASSTSSLFYLFTRGGSASIATFSVIALIASVTGAAVDIPTCLLIALACALMSFVASLSSGFEIMFITIAAMKVMGIDLYSAEVTMLGLLPLLSGLGTLVDTQIALLGSAVVARRSGVDVCPSYKDIM